MISCADSRVPPELIFGGHGVGELFVARNAGNLVDTATLGTVEYGAAVLGSPLIVVLAHSSCGAVKAACDVVTKNATYPGAIGPMIEPIVPAALAVKDQPGDFTDNAAKESARRTVARLPAASTILGRRRRRHTPRCGSNLRPQDRRGGLAGVGAAVFRAGYMPGIFVTSTTSIVAPGISRCGWPTNILAAASWEAASTIV